MWILYHWEEVVSKERGKGKGKSELTGGDFRCYKVYT